MSAICLPITDADQQNKEQNNNYVSKICVLPITWQSQATEQMHAYKTEN